MSQTVVAQIARIPHHPVCRIECTCLGFFATELVPPRTYTGRDVGQGNCGQGNIRLGDSLLRSWSDATIRAWSRVHGTRLG